MKITAAVVREKGKPFQFEELDLQDPREGEVMVKICLLYTSSSHLSSCQSARPWV